MKQHSFCGSIDSYLELATRQSIKATAHTLGFNLVGETGAAADTEVKAVKDGYAPDFYRLRPGQLYTPAYAQGSINQNLEIGRERIGNLQDDLDKAVAKTKYLEDQAVKSKIE